MRLHKSITPARIIAAVEADDCLGFRVACGDDAFGVEPDAENYECGSCGEYQIFGAEQLLFMMEA